MLLKSILKENSATSCVFNFYSERLLNGTITTANWWYWCCETPGIRFSKKKISIFVNICTAKTTTTQACLWLLWLLSRMCKAEILLIHLLYSDRRKKIATFLYPHCSCKDTGWFSQSVALLQKDFIDDESRSTLTNQEQRKSADPQLAWLSLLSAFIRSFP